MFPFLFGLSTILVVLAQDAQNSTENLNGDNLLPEERRQILRDFIDAETNLVDFLFKDYKKDIPATYIKARTHHHGLKMPLIANVTLMYTKMLSLNEIEQNIRLIAEAYVDWEDIRLTWDPSNFSDVDVIVIPRNWVWVPDIVPYDLSEWVEIIPLDKQMLTVFANGTLSYYMAGIGNFMCYLDISDFPFDSQECGIPYATYYAISSELMVNGFYDAEYNFKSVASNLWSVTGHRFEQRFFSDNVHNWNYTEVRYLYTFQRADGYYVVLIIIPSFVLTFLCMAGLFWAPISFDTYMDKLNLGFAAILSMVLVLQITTDSIPKTAQIPILSIYSLINLTLITVASLAVLLIGKYLLVKNRKSVVSTSRWKKLLITNVHIICLFFFTSAAIVNLIILLLKRKT